MKNICLFMIFACCCFTVRGQESSQKKQPTIGLHFFYNDFVTANLIKSTSLGTVLKNKQWNKARNMEGGFGIDYLQGINKLIDVVGTINASWVNYLLPSGILYGSSNLLIDLSAGAHIKLFSDKYIFDPFLITKAGFSSYKNINGFDLMPGAGLQVNLFKEAFILTSVEYRIALGNKLSNQLYYSIGIATNIFKPKVKIKVTEEVKPEIPVVKSPVIEEVKISKDVVVKVTDEATGLPLPGVAVTLKDSKGIIISGITNAEGKASFNNIEAGSYSINGILNKIIASTTNISKDDFAGPNSSLSVNITHNDPRFTLVGNTVDKNANSSVGNTEVAITNTTKSSTAIATSSADNGEFTLQLEAESDFTIVGKKASYISNIENLSTKGLNRSATLYVRLQLDIQEAKAGNKIVLNNIYFETGKAILDLSSADLKKLVQFLKDNPDARLEIQGHTDNVGNPLSNVKLSQLRANSVVNYLISNGIGKDRLVAKGYGASVPVADNKTIEGKAQNRRVEMKVLD